VGQLGHTVAASAALHLSQSAVARAVQDVEARLGQPLFERRARGMAPTPAGLVLLQRVGRALDALVAVDRPGRGRADTPLSWQAGRVAAAAGNHHLNAFLAVCRSGQEKSAAAQLGVSAAAVHEAVAQLEHLCGTALFERHRLGARPTTQGDIARRAVQGALAELSQAESELAALQGRLSGHVVIGTLPFSTGLFLPQAAEAVLKAHPGLQISIVDGTYDQLMRQLRFAELDLVAGALRDPATTPGLAQDTLFEDPLAVVARAGHPWARRPRLRMRELQRAAWIMPMPGTPAQAAFDQAFAAAGLAPPVDSLRINSPVLMLAALAAGDRVALMSPRHVQAELAAGLLCVLPVAVRHAPRRIGVVTRGDYLPPPGARLLLQAMREAVQGLDSAPPIKPDA
jgi:LysR family transcriptional regulator of gallate degradation